jgi:DNA polymerase III delta prime subunit
MSKFDIWVEKYRPQTLNDYVFKDSNMRATVSSWIEDQKLSGHILLSGIQGSGKCLDGDEILDLQFNALKMTSEQRDILFEHKSIRNLFIAFGCDNDQYNKEVWLPEDTIFIKSRDGFVPIRALVKKHTEVAQYKFSREDGSETSVVCSTEHLVFSKGELQKIRDCSDVDFIDGTYPVKEVITLGCRDVYDVALNPPHEYVLPNGLINHNTSLAKLILKLFNVPEPDVLEINASTENGIETIRTKILDFCSTWAMSDMRYVLLDECDSLSPEAQRGLRNILETYAENVRFIFTCNYTNKVIPALKSRLQEFIFKTLDQDEYIDRLASILVNENISFEPEALADYYTMTYPDLRKCINMLQQNSKTGVLKPPTDDSGATNDVMLSMAELFKAGQYKKAREMITKQIQKEEYDSVYRFMYDNLPLWGDNESQCEEAICIIARGLAAHASVSDPEINLAAVLVELSRLKQ